jgi:hypothetical protein
VAPIHFASSKGRLRRLGHMADISIVQAGFRLKRCWKDLRCQALAARGSRRLSRFCR